MARLEYPIHVDRVLRATTVTVPSRNVALPVDGRCIVKCKQETAMKLIDLGDMLTETQGSHPPPGDNTFGPP